MSTGISSSVKPLSPHEISGIRELQAETNGDSRIIVAILDGAVDTSHPAFAGANLRFVDTGTASVAAAGESAAHGTHIASVILGQGSGAADGIAPGCTGLIAPIFEDSSDGVVVPSTQAALSTAIRAAVDSGAHIINISAGQFAAPELTSTALADAIRYSEQQGRIVIAAAGNNGCSGCVHIPGSITSPALLAVGAIDESGEALAESNWGGTAEQQGIVAIGSNILGAAVGGGYEMMSGTSVATAVVSGVAALLLSLQLKSGLPLDAQGVRRALLRSALNCETIPAADCSRLMSGRLNASGAALIVRNQGANLMVSGIERGEHPSVTIANSDSHQSAGATFASDRADTQFAPTILPSRMSAGAAAGIDPSCISETASTSNGDDRALMPSCGAKPAGCGCGGSGSGGCSCSKGARQLVYVIGDQLGYDFGTQVREESMTANFSSGMLSREYFEHSLRTPVNMLRYLLGWDGTTGTSRSASAGAPIGGSFFDVKSVHWVLYQDACPIYVIQPNGMFAEAAYKQLLYFFIENSGIQLSDFGISPGCLVDFFECHGGSSDPLPHDADVPIGAKGTARTRKKKRGDDDVAHSDEVAEHGDDFFSGFLGEEPGKVARIAVAGEVTGKVQLSTGELVETVSPDLRGMASWNTERLIEETALAIRDEEIAREFAARVLAALYIETRNRGRSPEDRAKNWAATSFLLPLRNFVHNLAFQSMFGGLKNAAVSGVHVHSSDCRRTGSEYDVDVLFYSFENALRGQVALSGRVDVSDVVPVTLGRVRASTRR